MSDSRPVHFGGLGAIPLTEIEALMRVDGITGWDERYRFMLLIKTLDSKYLELQAERQKQRDKQEQQRQANSSRVGSSNLRPKGRLRR